jgi:cytochrome c biogenesis protein CcmG/thiol:disulfide interchange protein DsbE
MIGLALMVGLSLRPSEIPSALVGKTVPEFSLPPLDPTAEGLSSQGLKDGKVKLVNVFASWCVPCRIEHPLLIELQRQGVTIHGLNYKDIEDDARRFLNELKSPYTLIGQDKDGRVGIDWGVSGVPETFVIDGKGRILYQHIGPLDREAIEQQIAPLLKGQMK